MQWKISQWQANAREIVTLLCKMLLKNIAVLCRKSFLLGIYDCYETVWESRGIVMNNKLLLNDDIQNLDIIKDKMSVLLNDVELYFDNDNNRPELPCEQSCFDMEITRIRIIYDYIDRMEETINKMYDHVK